LDEHKALETLLSTRYRAIENTASIMSKHSI